MVRALRGLGIVLVLTSLGFGAIYKSSTVVVNATGKNLRIGSTILERVKVLKRTADSSIIFYDSAGSTTSYNRTFTVDTSTASTIGDDSYGVFLSSGLTYTSTGTAAAEILILWR